MKIIEIEVPTDVVEHCKKINISEENIKIVFKDYCYDKLGYYTDSIEKNFLEWTEDENNICDYAEESKKVFVEVKMIIQVELDKNNSIDDAINEMSENISSSDLISRKGCIVGGKIDEYIIRKIS